MRSFVSRAPEAVVAKEKEKIAGYREKRKSFGITWSELLCFARNYMKIFDLSIDSLIRLALAEDIGSGDKTTGLLIDGDSQGRARVIAKEDLVAAGFVPFERVFAFLSILLPAGF